MTFGVTATTPLLGPWIITSRDCDTNWRGTPDILLIFEPYRVLVTSLSPSIVVTKHCNAKCLHRDGHRCLPRMPILSQRSCWKGFSFADSGRFISCVKPVFFCMAIFLPRAPYSS